MTSSGTGWRSEEDYVLARLAVALGILEPAAVQELLQVQGQFLHGGQSLSLSQVMLRHRQLAPDELLRLKTELLRCHHRCPACGAGRYLAPALAPRVEACRA